MGWDGQLYDCDFNQQLGMGLAGTTAAGADNDNGNDQRRRRLSVFDVGSLAELEGRAVRVNNHCYGCTAGSGSSCGGALG